MRKETTHTTNNAARLTIFGVNRFTSIPYATCRTERGTNFATAGSLFATSGARAVSSGRCWSRWGRTRPGSAPQPSISRRSLSAKRANRYLLSDVPATNQRKGAQKVAIYALLPAFFACQMIDNRAMKSVYLEGFMRSAAASLAGRSPIGAPVAEGESRKNRAARTRMIVEGPGTRKVLDHISLLFFLYFLLRR